MTIVDDLRSTQSTPSSRPRMRATPRPPWKWGPPAAPDVLVRPTTPEEVGAALRVGGRGRRRGRRSQWWSRGWAPVPGGLLVDLGGFTRVEVGEDDVVRVGGGSEWGDVAEALAPHGLVLSAGDTRSVGVGGSTLGSGVGWLVRSVGLAADQLVGVQLVTADGAVVTASQDENAELFAALRGGGGNFGIATRLDFRRDETARRRVRNRSRRRRRPAGHDPRRPRRDARRATRARGHARLAAADRPRRSPHADAGTACGRVTTRTRRAPHWPPSSASPGAGSGRAAHGSLRVGPQRATGGTARAAPSPDGVERRLPRSCPG